MAKGKYTDFLKFIDPDQNNNSHFFHDTKRSQVFDDYLDHYNGFIRDANNIDYESSRKQTLKDFNKYFHLLDDEGSDVLDSYMLRKNYGPQQKNARVDSKPKKWETNRNVDDALGEALELSKKNPDMDVVYGLQYRNDKDNYGLKKPFLISDNDYYKIHDSLNPGNNNTFKIHTVKRRIK